MSTEIPSTSYQAKSNDIPPHIRAKYPNLETTMCDIFEWTKAKCFQVDGAIHQMEGNDLMVHVGTGSGKTAVAAAPYVLPQNSDKVTIFVSPLIALETEMVQTFSDKYRVPAVVINGTLGSEKLTQVLKKIKRLEYRIILISPEMLLSRRVRDEILTDSDFKKHVLSVVIDEAHVVSWWSVMFRKRYGHLHLVRNYLPKTVPFVGLSATLSPRVLRDVASRLHMPQGYQYINLGNERPDLSIIVRRMKYPRVSCKDAGFMIPENVFHPLDILKTFLYVDNKAEGYRLVTVLESLLPAHLQGKGLIRPFNARHSVSCREELMRQFKLGNIRILVCTDAAGMGCDVSDVEQVVQWGMTGMSPIVQRFGRAARGAGRTGRGVLIAEPSAYTYNPTDTALKETTTKTTNEKVPKYKRHEKSPLKKGPFAPTATQRQPKLHEESPLEGALAFIQTHDCRRKIWTSVFQNPPAAPVVDCCDICVPALLDLIQPPKPSRFQDVRHKRTPKKGVPQDNVRSALYKWRNDIWDRDHAGMSWGASALLSNSLVDLLSSIGPIPTHERLKEIIGHKWAWWDTYGDDLFGVLGALSVSFEPLPPKAPKRTAEPTQLEPNRQSQTKRGAAPSISQRGRKPSGSRAARSRNVSSTQTSPGASHAPPSFIYSNFNVPAVQMSPTNTEAEYTGPPPQHHYYSTSQLYHPGAAFQPPPYSFPPYGPYGPPPFQPAQYPPPSNTFPHPPPQQQFPAAPSYQNQADGGPRPYARPLQFAPGYFPPPPPR